MDEFKCCTSSSQNDGPSGLVIDKEMIYLDKVVSVHEVTVAWAASDMNICLMLLGLLLSWEERVAGIARDSSIVPMARDVHVPAPGLFIVEDKVARIALEVGMAVPCCRAMLISCFPASPE